jgi:hypothetical protein
MESQKSKAYVVRENLLITGYGVPVLFLTNTLQSNDESYQVVANSLINCRFPTASFRITGCRFAEPNRANYLP